VPLWQGDEAQHARQRFSRACTPRTAPAIMRLSAAIDSPPSSVGGIVAKPMAEALGYRAKICSNSAASWRKGRCRQSVSFPVARY
jgi:hypothetical protein